jgi:hypothetical protein
MCQFLGKSSPGRPLSEVKIVSGDGFFDTETIRRLGFTNANFILDQWHFINSGLEKMFGPKGYEILKPYLLAMIHAPDETTFNIIHKDAVSMLESRPCRNGAWEGKLREFVSNHATFASYCIARMPGNRGLHGSASAEQNNSSLLCHLNDGNKNGNNFLHQTVNNLIRETMLRQKWAVSTFHLNSYCGLSRHCLILHICFPFLVQ